MGQQTKNLIRTALNWMLYQGISRGTRVQIRAAKPFRNEKYGVKLAKGSKYHGVSAALALLKHNIVQEIKIKLGPQEG